MVNFGGNLWPGSGNFVFFTFTRVILFVRDRHSPGFVAAEIQLLYFAQHLTVSLKDTLTKNKVGPNLKQNENTRTLDFETLCKIKLWDTAITLDDIERVWETILNVPSQKLWKTARGGKPQNKS